MMKNIITPLDINSEAISDFQKRTKIQSDEINNAFQKMNEYQNVINRSMERMMQGDLSVKLAMERMMKGFRDAMPCDFRDVIDHGDNLSINEYLPYMNVDAEAAIKFLGYLESSLNDPEIKKSEVISAVIAKLLNVMGELDSITSSKKRHIDKALGFSDRSATNKGNARKPRFPEKYSDASDVCKKWFDEPSIYKTKSAFYMDIVDKGFCKDNGTVGEWLKKFIQDLDPGAAWLKKFGPKISG